MHEISWTEFETRWVPGFTTDEILVGVNWSGPRATGYDVSAKQVRDNVQAQIIAKVRKPPTAASKKVRF